MTCNSKSARLFRSLTEEEKDYFRAINWLWESSDVPLFRTVEDIQDTGGAVGEDTRVILVIDVHEFRKNVSPSEVSRVSQSFAEVLRKSDSPDFYDDLPSVSDWFEGLGLPTEDSYGILIKTDKETGSEDYPKIEHGDIDLADLIDLIG